MRISNLEFRMIVWVFYLYRLIKFKIIRLKTSQFSYAPASFLTNIILLAYYLKRISTYLLLYTP